MADATRSDLAARGRAAARALRGAGSAAKDAALTEIAAALVAGRAAILAANADDLAEARAAGTSAALLDRLALDDARLEALAQSVLAIRALPDPVGRVVDGQRRPNGLEIARVRTPLGRVLVVYEARPNVTVDVAALCLKSGNVALLRGSSSARRTNAALVEAVRAGVLAAGLPADAVLVVDASRAELAELVADAGLAEVVIPRGGEALKDFLLEHSRIPVLVAAGGICHTYLDAPCDHAMAERIVLNAKVQRPGVCNAMETLLVHREHVDVLLPRVLAALAAAGVELRGCPRTVAAAGATPVAPATDADWATEYLDLVLAVRVVDSVEEALDHIARYATGHSEAIVTASVAAADAFIAGVDSACTYVNASTRFTDGGEYGMGAEIGNATGRLHVRGPIGLDDLTTLRYVVRGSGQTR